jgi:hypothetical protein
MTSLLSDILSSCTLDKKIIIKREIDDGWLNPVSDVIEINYDQIVSQLS